MKKFVYLSVLLVTIACQTEPDDVRLFDDLVVSTNYDQGANFSNYTTYAIPKDTIGFISNSVADTILTASRSSLPRPVLSAIRANMQSRGFNEVDKTEAPDIGINVLVVNDFNVFQQVVYPSYYGGYYGYSSFYYYPYVNTYAYNTGVLVIELVDLKNRTSSNQVKVLWSAYLGDVYSTVDLIKQSVDAVNQAFVQSPYISK